MNNKIEEAGIKYARRYDNFMGYSGKSLAPEDRIEINAFVKGAISDAAKEYWYEQFEKQKLEFAINLLKVIEEPNGDLLGNKIKLKIEELQQQLG